MVDPYLLYLAMENAKSGAFGLTFGTVVALASYKLNIPFRRADRALAPLAILIAIYGDIENGKVIDDFGFLGGIALGFYITKHFLEKRTSKSLEDSVASA